MASDLSKFFKDRQVIILLLFLLISIGSIALLGVEQGLDLKGGSSIQLQLEHPVNDSTMKVVRGKVEKAYADRIDHMYTPEGKNIFNEMNMKSL